MCVLFHSIHSTTESLRGETEKTRPGCSGNWIKKRERVFPSYGSVVMGHIRSETRHLHKKYIALAPQTVKENKKINTTREYKKKREKVVKKKRKRKGFMPSLKTSLVTNRFFFLFKINYNYKKKRNKEKETLVWRCNREKRYDNLPDYIAPVGRGQLRLCRPL